MNRRRNAFISLISALLSILLVYGVYQLQLKQIEMQEQIKVVVPKQFIAAGKYVSEDMLEYKQLLTAAYHSRMLTNKADAVGLETVIPLGKDEPVLDWKLDKFGLMPTSEQVTFQIPKDYILSIANEVRAGDQVKLFLTGNGTSSLLFPDPITVASVKSSANIEVTDRAETHLLSRARGDYESMYTSRRSANGSIDDINLNLTDDQWLKLDQACREGKGKLVIAYAPAQFAEHDGTE